MLVLLLADWPLSSVCSQFISGEWQYMWLSLHIPSICAIMATLLMNILGNDRSVWRRRLTAIHRRNHPIHEIIKSNSTGISFWWTHMWHKYLNTRCAFWQVDLHACSPDFLVTNFPLIFFPSPWTASQTISSLWTDINLQLLLSLLSTAQHPANGKISIHCSLSGPSGMRLYSAAAIYFLMVIAYHPELSVKHKYDIFLSLLIIGSSLWGHRLRENRQCSRSRGHGHLGHFLVQHTCAFTACFSLISYISLSFYNEYPQFMLNIMAWWMRQYLFVMGSSGHMVVLWPMVKLLLSTKAQ